MIDVFYKFIIFGNDKKKLLCNYFCLFGYNILICKFLFFNGFYLFFYIFNFIYMDVSIIVCN